MSNEFEKELNWDDEIEKDSQEFTLLPEGIYDFKVTSFERARHSGSEKLPACNKAIIFLRIDSQQGSTTVRHNLFLHTITEGMLSAFFNAIGQKKHGEKLQMNWSTVVGSTGRCKIYINKWTNDKGEEIESNQVKRFYDPADAPTQQDAKAFTPGAF